MTCGHQDGASAGPESAGESEAGETPAGTSLIRTEQRPGHSKVGPKE